MYKKIIIIAVAVVTGFLSGYFSSSIEGFISGLEFPEFKLNQISWFSIERSSDSSEDVSDTSAAANSVEGSITGEAAVNAVKALPVVKELAAYAVSRGYKVTFSADQPPTREYPVWLVELRQVYPNQIPDILFVKVDSLSGKVLDIQAQELHIAGFKISAPLPLASEAGKPQVKSVYNENLKRKVRIAKYEGFEVESDKDKEVIRITVTGQELKGPRGLTVGSDVSNVVKKFGKANIAHSDLLIFDVLGEKNIQLHVKIDNGKVASFSMIKIIE